MMPPSVSLVGFLLYFDSNFTSFFIAKTGVSFCSSLTSFGSSVLLFGSLANAALKDLRVGVKRGTLVLY